MLNGGVARVFRMVFPLPLILKYAEFEPACISK